MGKGKVTGLYGINGLYNYGCEAIVRGTVRLLRLADPEAEIIYFSTRKDEDEKAIKDLGIEVRQINRRHLSIPERGINKIRREMAIPKQINDEDFAAVLDACDTVISIGGDIYTIPGYLREKKRYTYFNKMIEFGNLAKKKGKKLIIIGASIGPFGQFEPAVKYYKDGLSRSDLILAREPDCITYLNSIGIKDNLDLMPDPAFFVEVSGDAPKTGEYVGINLSPWSLQESFGSIIDEALKERASLITGIMDKTGMPVMLIPHVLAYKEDDNDHSHMLKLLEHMDEEHKARVKLVKPESFIDAKRYIRQCRFVIASRMHCAVNSICEGVPALLLSYSRKAVGMSEFVYGNGEWVLPVYSANDEIIAKAMLMNGQAEDLSKSLSDKVAEVREKITSEESFMRFRKELLG